MTCDTGQEKNIGASRWRVCYQRGLPRLAFKLSTFTEEYGGSHQYIQESIVAAGSVKIDYGGHQQYLQDGFVAVFR